MRKLTLLFILQFLLLGGILAQPSGNSWYSQDFTALNGQVLNEYQDGKAMWDTTEGPNTNNHWNIITNTYNGDDGTSQTDYFRVWPDGDTDNQQDEILVSRVDLPKEDDVANVPNEFFLNFTWWSDQENLGGGTDPTLDPDASITVEISFYEGGSWGSYSEIWAENDQETLEETTYSAPNGDFNWDDYNDDLEGWYKTEIDFSDMAGSADSVKFRFRYTGIDAGDFRLDDFDVRYNTVDDWEQEVRVEPNYRTAPRLMAENMDMKFVATLTKNTSATFDDTENDEVELQLEWDLFAYADVQQSDFDDGKTQTYDLTNFVGDFPKENDDSYYFHINNQMGGNSDFYTHFDINSSYFQRDNGTNDASVSADLESPGVGVLYHFPKAEHWRGVNAYFDATSDFNYQLIKVDGPDATSGEVLYTSEDFNSSNLYDNFTADEQMKLEAGYYIVMINQLTTTDMELRQDDQSDGFYYRGTADNLTKVENTGFPHIRMRLQENRAPKFADGNEYPATEYTHKVSAKQEFSYTFYAYDADMDDIGIVRKDPAQDWLKADWLSVTQKSDTSFTLSGKPEEAKKYELDMKMGDAEEDSSATKTFTIDVLPPYELDFAENFGTGTGTLYSNTDNDKDGWTTIDDAAGNGSSKHWSMDKNTDHPADPSDATAKFKTSDNKIALILGQSGVVQEEWLISPAISLPNLEAGTDSALHLEFAWNMNWKYFTGPEDGNNNDGYDAGDVTVMVSTDGGANWTELWKEDDSTNVVSTTIIHDNNTTANDEYYDDDPLDPEGWPGYAGGNYNYSATDYYLSRINMADYAGQDVWIAFKYESDNSPEAYDANFRLDYVDMKAIEPGIELRAKAVNTAEYTQIPITQVQPVSVMGKVSNRKRMDLTGGEATGSYTFSGNTVYNNTVTFDVNGEDTTDVDFGTFTPEEAGAYNFQVDASYIDEEGTSHSITDGPSKMFEVTPATKGVYAKDNDNFGSNLVTEQGDYYGMKFDIHNNDKLRKIRLYVHNASSGDEISFTLVKDGEVVMNSPSYVYDPFPVDGEFADNSLQTFDIEDLDITPGEYYLMVKTEAGAPEFGYDDDEEGYYYEGKPGEIVANEESMGNLMLRMELGNDAPVFNPALEMQEAIVGAEFMYNISATDANRDSLTFILEDAPAWVSLENQDDGNRAILSGMPGSGDVGSNLVQVGVFDARDTTSEFFTIEVAQSPAPEFTTSPATVAEEGLAYEYMALGMDPLGDDITFSLEQAPEWMTDSLYASGDTLTISGVPEEGNVGENHIKINLTDEYGKTTQQAFTVVVKANADPEFITFASLHANEGEEYTYNVKAEDANSGDELTLAATAPEWLIFTDNGDGTGVLSGTPEAADEGANDVTLTVSDSKGATAEQSFTIMVDVANTEPAFTSAPEADTVTVQAGTLFSYHAMVEDADGDPISFTVDAPNWMLATNDGGGTLNLRGQPMLGELGVHDVAIEATDGQAPISQSFAVDVIDTTEAPVVKKSKLDKAYANTSYEGTVEASDADGDELSYTAKDIPAWLTLTENADGSARLSGMPASANLGTHTLSISVSDGLHEITAELELEVIATTTGIDNEAADKLNMYPNPAAHIVTFENVAEGRMAIYNLTGAKVFEKADLNATERLDVTHFKAGTYLIKVVKDNTTFTRTLLVK